MTTDQQDARHLGLLAAARRLEQDALVAARGCEPGSRDWHFYYGVTAAALDRIHPERASVHEDRAWLDAQPPSFRAGFVEASTLLSHAATTRDLQVQVRLPEPPPASRPRPGSQ